MKQPLVDAHQHFWWQPTVEAFPWMTDELALLRRTYGPEDLRPHLNATGIGRTVVVQASATVRETEHLLDVADTTDFVCGVVGWVDLTAPDVAEAIARLRERPGGRYLVSVRHQVHDEPDPEWLLRPDVRRGLEAVQAAGLAFDLLVRPRELPAAVALARALPELRLVLDHIGKPPIREGAVEPWASHMAAFAPLPQVACKVSGMVTEARWDAWTLADLAPYVARVAEWFGPRRLMFGSDWPVCLLAGSYEQVLQVTHAALSRALGGLTGEVELAVFGSNAARVYGLDGST